METVLVFRTSVTKRNQVRRLRPLLNRTLNGSGEWNFDLEDCDNILRVEAHKLTAEAICSIVRMHGFRCEEL